MQTNTPKTYLKVSLRILEIKFRLWLCEFVGETIITNCIPSIFRVMNVYKFCFRLTTIVTDILEDNEKFNALEMIFLCNFFFFLM